MFQHLFLEKTKRPNKTIPILMKKCIIKNIYIYIYMFFSKITTRTSITLTNMFFTFVWIYNKVPKIEKSLNRRFGSRFGSNRWGARARLLKAILAETSAPAPERRHAPSYRRFSWNELIMIKFDEIQRKNMKTNENHLKQYQIVYLFKHKINSVVFFLDRFEK